MLVKILFSIFSFVLLFDPVFGACHKSFTIDVMPVFFEDLESKPLKVGKLPVFVDKSFFDGEMLLSWEQLKDVELETSLTTLIDERTFVKQRLEIFDFEYWRSSTLDDRNISPAEGKYLFRKMHYLMLSHYLVKHQLGKQISSNEIVDDDRLLLDIAKEISQLRNAIVVANMGLVFLAAKNYAGSHLRELAFSEALSILTNSIKSFDHRKDMAFSTYLYKGLENLYTSMKEGKREPKTIAFSSLKFDHDSDEDSSSAFGEFDPDLVDRIDAKARVGSILEIARQKLSDRSFNIFISFYGMKKDVPALTVDELAKIHSIGTRKVLEILNTNLRILKNALGITNDQHSSGSNAIQ